MTRGELANVLGRRMNCRRWAIWCGAVLTPEKCRAYREKWASKANQDVDELERIVDTTETGDCTKCPGCRKRMEP